MQDVKNIRYQLVKSTPGDTEFNWLFLPGGPGVDSSYFLELIDQVELPGKIWLIDFPGNGSNFSDTIPAEYNFDHWDDCLLSAVKKFERPVLVGHSFGGMFPLLFPELEHILNGFVILNSAPSAWFEEAEAYAKQHNIAPCSKPIEDFVKNPNQETFKGILLACAPYYFSEENIDKGKAFLAQMSINYHAAQWWLKKVHDIKFNAKWIPQTVETLVIGASHDFITPFSLFEKDMRFCRNNIMLKKIKNAGHFPWREQGKEIREIFNAFVGRLK